jgi:hypothetical protein
MRRYNSFYSNKITKNLVKDLPVDRSLKRKRDIKDVCGKTQYSISLYSLREFSHMRSFIKNRISEKVRSEYTAEYSVFISRSGYFAFFLKKVPKLEFNRSKRRAYYITKSQVTGFDRHFKIRFEVNRMKDVIYKIEKHLYIKVSYNMWRSFREVKDLGSHLVDVITSTRNKSYTPLVRWEDNLISKLKEKIRNIENNSLPPPSYRQLLSVPKGKPGSGIFKRIIGKKRDLHYARVAKAGHGYRGLWFIPKTADVIPGYESEVLRCKRMNFSQKDADSINRVLQENPTLSWDLAIKSVKGSR